MAARNWSDADQIVYEPIAAGLRLADKGWGVISGGVPSEKSPPGLFVTLTACTYVINGTEYSFAGQDIAISAAPTTATYTRMDLIYADATGPLYAAGVAGAPPSDASYPDPVALPANSIPIALVEVGNSVTQILDARIVDARSTTHYLTIGDPHTQYATSAELTTHEGAADPHTGYLKETVVSGMAAPALTLGTSNAQGNATTAIPSNSTILAFDATAPVTQAFGDAAAAGAATVAARRDHTHGMPSLTAVTILDRKNTTTSVTNSVAETTVYSKSVSGNTLGANGGLRLTLYGDLLNNSGAGVTYRVRIKFGATTIFDSTAVSIATSASWRNWKLVFDLLNVGATNSQRNGAVMFITPPNAAQAMTLTETAALSLWDGIGIAASAEDTTADKTLAVTIQMGTASAQATFEAYFGTLERLPTA